MINRSQQRSIASGRKRNARIRKSVTTNRLLFLFFIMKPNPTHAIQFLRIHFFSKKSNNIWFILCAHTVEQRRMVCSALYPMLCDDSNFKWWWRYLCPNKKHQRLQNFSLFSFPQVPNRVHPSENAHSIITTFFFKYLHLLYFSVKFDSVLFMSKQQPIIRIIGRGQTWIEKPIFSFFFV